MERAMRPDQHRQPAAEDAKAPAPVPRGGWQAVLAMQQTAGNRATGRAIAAAGKGSPIDGLLAGHQGMLLRAEDEAVPDAVGGKAPASQPVSITTVLGPKDLGRGGYDWKVWFSMASPAGAAGWVVQEVTATFKTTGAGGSTKTYHYWEAWEVDKGKSVTVWQDKSLDDNDDQYYCAPAAAGTKGINTLVGAVKFYEGPLPADFKKNNPSTIAGILHSTVTKPAFWDGGGTAHNITATWDDSGAAPVTDVEAVAGGTKLKGTP